MGQFNSARKQKQEAVQKPANQLRLLRHLLTLSEQTLGNHHVRCILDSAFSLDRVYDLVYGLGLQWERIPLLLSFLKAVATL